MDSFIQLEKSNCQNCYKCIRACPVKSIQFKDHQAQVLQNDCIQCGMCFVVCPQNAKKIRNDVDNAKALLKTGKPVYISLAPSFAANYPNIGIEGIRQSAKKLGFADVQETALGATAVKGQYENLVDENPKGVIISSCCHSLNSLVEKYYPEALSYLAKVITPMQAHCRMIKEENPQAYTVFVGPCISKKAEAEQYKGDVDCVLTFDEFTSWLKEEHIELAACENQDIGGKARLFPTTGGIIRTMKTRDDVNYIAIDGADNCINAIKDIIAGNIDNCFIEMSFCTGSCIGGPVMENATKRPITDCIKINSYAKDEDFEIVRPSNMTKSHFYLGTSSRKPGSADIEKILSQMGKADEKKQLNCGSCGYNTCKEKAIAVYQGKAEINMCLPYLLEKSQSFSDNVITHTPNGIIVMDKDLNIQQINQAACDIVNLPLAKTIIGLPIDRIMDPSICRTAIESRSVIKDKVTYMADYDKYVSQTAFYDEEYHVTAVIMRDVTEEQTSKERKLQTSAKAVEITNKVIEKQMRVVQEIASLLGETVAETQVALSKMEDTLQDE